MATSPGTDNCVHCVADPVADRQEAHIDPLAPAPFAAACATLLVGAMALAALRPRWIIEWPWLVLFGVAVVSAAATGALIQTSPPGLRLVIDPSTEPLLPRNDPAREAYAQAVRDFGDDQLYVIALESDTLFETETLERLRRVNDAIARFPEVRRVQSLVDVTTFRYVPADDWIEVAPFIEDIPTDPEALAELRTRALADPLYRRTILSDDGRTTAINVTFRELSDRAFIEARVDERITEILDRERTPDAHFYVAGRPHLKARVYHWMLRDLRFLIPAGLLVLATGLALILGTRRAVLIPLLNVGLGTLWTFGAMAALARPLSVLTTLMAPMLIAIGSVYGIHALSRYEEETLAAKTPAEAALRALEHLRTPVCVAALTTVAGFAALMITDVPAVFELGAFSVLGVASIAALNLTLVPAALSLFPMRSAMGGATRLSARIDGLLAEALGALGAFTARHAQILLIVFALAAALAAAAVPRIVIDTDYLSFFDPDTPVRRDFSAIDRLLSGAIPLFVAFRGPGAATFRDPEALRAIESMQVRAAELPHVGRTLSVVDTLRVMNRALSRDDPKAERIPDTKPAVAELMFMAPKDHLDRYTNVNHSRANLFVRTGAVGTAAVHDVTAGLEALIEDTSLPEGVDVTVTGNALLLARSADGIARGQPLSIAVAALTILFLVAFGVRSLRLGLIAMLPNLAPVLLYFGSLGLGLAPLSLPTSLIGCVALGIAIDDTVHFLVRFVHERRAGRSPEEAARLCTRRIGRPIVITSLMLIAGFAVVGFSNFATLAQFGWLSAGTMALCLLTDLVLLPALLVRAGI